ncbi:transglutaminase family protein [Xylophilus sp. GOD-11R]|uniref:transglutaminase family protein n=1 Tax=Xylophilus sp. GOD-11R TaxID=3089814 RepID=UPI00298D4AE1|nr:transglutaminase family protein [Xylophilus sp. GOD-11R]WPB58198.1 transglutaminase family protein [Xylophilus sp. GOD-11R]
MSIHAALHHVTHYKYDRPVLLGPQVVRLRPAPHCRSNVISYSLRIEPTDHFVNWQQDPFSNYLARLVIPEKTREFKVTVDLVVEMAVYNPFDFFLEPEAEQFPFRYAPKIAQELAPYLVPEPATPLVTQYLKKIDRTERATIDFLVALNQQVQGDVRYLIRMEPGVQTPEETLEKACGSCRDSTWLLVNLMRHMGLAARFVSGYLIQLTPDVKSLDGPSGTEIDFTDLHAWCEVYLPGAGWVGLDPTSGLFAGEGHIPLACTPTPGSAAPIEGALMERAEVEFRHEMTVSRVHESPRVTLPYTDTQWHDVLSLGDAVDAELRAQDVRLTMGGEPTFVAIENRDAPEWNTAAMGPTKRKRATDLVEKLRAEYAPGGFLHTGQGKWYPGEQLPRWAMGIYWRTDGQPCWTDQSLLADEREPQTYTADDAERFVRRLTAELGLKDEFVEPAYEDTFYYLWRERRLPINVDVLDARISDELERERLRRVFDKGLSAVTGWLLPLQAAPRIDAERPDEPIAAAEGAVWATGPWFIRDGVLRLLPGDSPMGYRLPLDSLPWMREEDIPYVIDLDPSAPRRPLPASIQSQAKPEPAAEASGAVEAVSVAVTRVPERFESASWTTRTGLCVEVRDPSIANGPEAEAEARKKADKDGRKFGMLYVFMPPMAHLEDYLSLLSAVEATAAALQMKIVVEGYAPPRDPRIQLLAVTPDPGVIEVNIQPVHSWRELVRNTEFLYDAAFRSRLSAEKFMTDGRHTGTGGGNHFVLGGATPDDSPFLRKPELLASLVMYWHNHPSLSYLFSGMFVGPTSQSPRVDEARNDQVYELEIAVQQIRAARVKYGEAMAPWMVDRTLRNILIDITGNTHRAEFCIDKLYSPDSVTGRLGLLELRAFEMPPHPRMSVVQQLLLRALVARFWKKPYEAPIARWGTTLHDKFMLPGFLQADFEDVIEEMRSAGYAFDAAWFAPHFEFRFPRIGAVEALGMQMSLRTALEPWHVMGEETAGGGTVRFVDSSVERIEVRVTGLDAHRHTVLVNGRQVPLQPTGTEGEYIAGVRYKAWNPYSALHPTIEVHAPLTFDIVDVAMKRAIAGCRYHVAHPGGRNYTTLPVNANEAESRRLARFFRTGHSAGELKMPEQPISGVAASREFPCTLDLRRS